MDVEAFAGGLIGSSEVALRLGLSSGAAFHRLRKLEIGAVRPSLWPRPLVEAAFFSAEAINRDALF
jgi:hypothetical protein